MRPGADRVELGTAGSQVVQDEQAAGLEQVEDEVAALLGRVLEAAAVEEEQPEWSARREQLAPVADEQLDVRVRAEALRRRSLHVRGRARR